MCVEVPLRGLEPSDSWALCLYLLIPYDIVQVVLISLCNHYSELAMMATTCCVSCCVVPWLVYPWSCY